MLYIYLLLFYGLIDAMISFFYITYALYLISNTQTELQCNHITSEAEGDNKSW